MLSKYLNPKPKYATRQGFKPNNLINMIRFISLLIIKILRLNGRSRWSNEFIQKLDPFIEVPTNFFDIRSNKKLWFRTGHGRLLWRSKDTLDIEPEINEWIKSFKKNDVFYDIGANIGVYSLFSSKLKNVRTYAFEPDLMNARILYENIIKNNVSNLTTIIPLGLSDKNYCTDFFLKTLSYGDALHNIDKKNEYVIDQHEAVVKVPIFTLDTLVNQLNLAKPTKLKIDVDGVEYEILKGTKKTLSTVTSIIVEWNKSHKNYKKMYQYLTKLGFILFKEGEQENSYINVVNAIFHRK